MHISAPAHPSATGGRVSGLVDDIFGNHDHTFHFLTKCSSPHTSGGSNERGMRI